MGKQQTPYQKSQKVKEQVRKDVRAGKIAPGNSPSPSRSSSIKKK